LCVILLKKF